MPQLVTEDMGGFDVLVVGGGIAGTTAALASAEEGARTAVACAGALFGGSSFFPGTWGLGLVGPDGAGDVDDFVETIGEVGRGVACPGLTRTLVEGVEGAVGRLERRGCRLRAAVNAGEREFIPCFDRKTRSWHGLERNAYRSSTEAALEEAGCDVCAGLELMDLRRAEVGWTAIFYDRGRDAFAQARAGSVVLATGGFGGLFERTLTMPDVLGTAQAIALEQGASLVNCEFMQIMVGLVAPVEGVVFNEKTFRHSRIEGLGRPELLGMRSGHGPFSASWGDREVDLFVARAGRGGAPLRLELPDPLPEFMRTYAEWLRDTYGITPGQELRVAHYAHAANGGIRIDGRAAVVGCPGLFACGECAGGMHGADRIGGLASASALVFGHIAGKEAARAAAVIKAGGSVGDGPRGGLWRAGLPASASPCVARPFPCLASPSAESATRALRHAMTEHCLVERSEAGLRTTLKSIDRLRADLAREASLSEDAAAVAATRRAELSLLSAEALARAMLTRRESRGAHYRSDFPAEDPAQACPLVVRYKEGRLVAAPLCE